MLGAIIGDIVGSRFEFNPTNDYHFELFTKECSFTDDTICTIAVADALLKGKDYGRSIHEWCRKYPHPMGGYGGRFSQWVRSDEPRPYGSLGNGSAMRVSPIGWWFDHPGDLFEEAEKSASCTHNHPEGILGAQAVACAIAECRILRKDRKGKKITREDMLRGGLNHAIRRYAAKPEDFHIRLEEHRNKFDETCQGTVPVALAIILNSTGFEDAIRQAVSLGADADTLGAIVGSIAEALWGIPEWMKQKALSYLPDEMKAVLAEFRRRVNRERRLAQKSEKQRLETIKSLMFWKLTLGNPNKILFGGGSPMPAKETVATKDSWGVQCMPDNDDDVSQISLDLFVHPEDMDTVHRGHIPEAQEDHWFMYCDDEYIRYYRSWTGMCAFEAHYRKADNEDFHIDRLKINCRLTEFGVNGDDSAVYLFRYLLTAEIGGDAEAAWIDYLEVWEKIQNQCANNHPG